MSRFPKEKTPRTAAKAADKRSRKHDHANCERPPTDPDGLIGDYNDEERNRHAPWVLKVRWNEVTTDTTGNTIRLRRYNLEWQHSKDDGAHWGDAGRARVPAKNDDDDNTKAHYAIPKIRPRLDYRFRVQAEATNGCRSSWSGWLDVGPATETPPEPTDVTLDIDEHSAHASWNLPDDADIPDERDQRITHIGVQLYRGTVDPPNLVDEDRHRVSEHWHTKLRQPPRDITYTFRVRTGSAAGTWSNWVTTTATKDTPSTPAAPAIAFDAMGPRHARFRALVTIAEVADTDFDIAYYRVQFVDKRASGTPTTSDDREHRHVKAKGSAHELVAIFRGVPAEHFTYARTQAVDKDNKESEWSSWEAGGKPSASDDVPDVIVSSYIVNRRRVGVKYTVPIINNIPDERIAHVHVQIATDNGFTSIRDEHYKHAGPGAVRYAVPVGDATLDFYVRLRSIDGAGNLGDWVPSPTGHLLNPDGDTAGVDEVGTVKHWSGKIAHIPASWLLCNGQAVSRATWPELNALYASDGYPYGSGDGSTTFNVPDIRNRKMMGALDDSQVGANEGLAVGSRDDNHDVHGVHSTHGPHSAHSGHGAHGAHITHGAHSDHSGHGGHSTDSVQELSHQHQSAGWLGMFGPSTFQSNISAQGTQRLATDTHTHSIFGKVAPGDSHAHSHAAGHDVSSGTGHSSHAGHGVHAEHFAGEHDVTVDGHTAHGAHSAHTEHNTSEHDFDRPGGKGHRPHPHHKGHWIVRASSS